MKQFILTALAVSLLMAAPLTGLAKDLEQTRCPIMGGPPNEKIFADYKGKRVYFCCPPCIDEFNKDPEKYLKMMDEAGIKVEDAPKEQ